MYSENFHRMMRYMLNWEGRILEYDPDDPGGMTCCGICKAAFPNWKGWRLVDTTKANNREYAKIALVDGSPLMNAVLEQYHALWTKYELDNYDFMISMEIMDQVVNPGPFAMATNGQKILNAMNYENKYGVDLAVDGSWGKLSKQRLAQVIADGKGLNFAIAMNCEQGYYYRNLTTKNSKKRKWYAGWLKRCELIR